MQYNSEQQLIIDSDGYVTTVSAKAGTGKSTTLDGYTRKRQKNRFLNLCFNKSVQLSANERFPTNVVNKTTHGMAFPKFGSKYANAKKLVPDLKPNAIQEVLPQNMSPTVMFVFAAGVIQVVNNFISSADDHIDIKHLQNLPMTNLFQHTDLLPPAMKLWSRMVDIDDHMGITHDGYLKLWALSRPRLDKYDYILLDEAQDTTPAVIDVLQSQSSRKVIVGDSHQSLYAFRGARDAMNMFKTDISLPITTSYRFGPNIALLSNMVIQTFKNEPHLLRGARESDVIGSVDKSKPYAVIAKTNIGLFDQAVDAIQSNLKIHYVGGINGYSLDLILDAHRLRMGETYSIRDQFIRSFKSFDDYILYSEQSEDVQSKNLIKICENYGIRIPDLIERIKQANVDTPTPNPKSRDIEDTYRAQVFLTTTHKSKGLEFNQAILCEDFTNLIDGNNYASAQDLSETDINLHYVAITRAKHRLQLNQQLKDFVAVFKQKRIARQNSNKGS